MQSLKRSFNHTSFAARSQPRAEDKHCSERPPKDGFEERPDVKPFALLRDRILPALESRRAAFEAMYAEVQGRPEIDPVLLAGLTILQMM
ncbi:MAG: hypothetical protein WCK89_06260 [bacterium]